MEGALTSSRALVQPRLGTAVSDPGLLPAGHEEFSQGGFHHVRDGEVRKRAGEELGHTFFVYRIEHCRMGDDDATASRASRTAGNVS